MTKVRHFPLQRRSILKAIELIDMLPADTHFYLTATEDPEDAQLHIWVMPGEVEDFRKFLGLYNYECKETDFVTYVVGHLNVSIIEKENTSE